MMHSLEMVYSSLLLSNPTDLISINFAATLLNSTLAVARYSFLTFGTSLQYCAYLKKREDKQGHHEKYTDTNTGIGDGFGQDAGRVIFDIFLVKVHTGS